jgi:hypothetical protein
LSPRASILVLTHDRTVLLGHSVASALAQTVADVEVLIVGDGVTEATRSAAIALTADPRVRFLDYPKGPHRGEVHRDTSVRAATSNAIFYLCDDDLLMPTHVESLLALLETHNFVQSKNCWVDEEGRVRPYVADLSSSETIAWHLRDDILYNAVSITGTAHLRDFYIDSNQPWSTTPPGHWPDHYQWRKLFAQPNFSGATSARVTAVQFPSTVSHRTHWTESEQLVELEHWIGLLAAPNGAELLEERFNAGTLFHLEQTTFGHHQSQFEARQLHAELDALRGSRSWKLTAPLRALYAWGRRIKARVGSAPTK